MASGNKKQAKKTSSSGGTLSGMRSGMQRMAGSGSKTKKAKQPRSFAQVFTWVLGAAVLLFLFYLLARR